MAAVTGITGGAAARATTESGTVLGSLHMKSSFWTAAVTGGSAGG